MNLHALPCVSFFDPPEPEDDSELRRHYSEMTVELNTDMLLDAIDAAGSMHAFLKRVLAVLGAPANTEAERIALGELESCVMQDVETLLTAIAKDNR